MDGLKRRLIVNIFLFVGLMTALFVLFCMEEFK